MGTDYIWRSITNIVQQIWIVEYLTANKYGYMKIGCIRPVLLPQLHGLLMNIPDRIITEAELRRNTGERGTRKFIAHKGIVYDVTDCPKWQNDLHENLHFPGQDLTGELEEAPHEEDVFRRPCVRIAGRLAS